MILFLDFDGVAHPDGCEIDQLFGRLPLLEQVLREFPQVQVVISSSWGQVHPLGELREFFSNDIKPRVVATTRGNLTLQEIPTRLWNFVREAQCDAWMRAHRPGEPWIALDDQAWRFDPAGTNVILIQGTSGITEADMQQLRLRLRTLVDPLKGGTTQEVLQVPQALVLYSQGKITGTEAQAELGVDPRGLIALLARHGLPLLHIERSRAEEMARESLRIAGIAIKNPEGSNDPS